MTLTIVALVALLAAAIAIAALVYQVRRAAAAQRDADAGLEQLRTRFASVIDADAERQRVLTQLAVDRARLQTEASQDRLQAEAALHALRDQHQRIQAESTGLATHVAALRAELTPLEEQAFLQSFGFYKPHYEFANSSLYKDRLDAVYEAQKQLVKNGQAAVAHGEWTVNGSRAEGRKQIAHFLKLALRAFNGECDAAIAKVRYNNIAVMEKRIGDSYAKINSHVAIQQCEITQRYLRLKLDELHLAHEYEEKKQAEREEQRQIREQMREEEAAARELERAQEEAEREASRYEEALRKARSDVERAAGAKQEKLLGQIAELERKVAEAQANKQRAISRAQMTRSGHVYVISNVGSFGEDVYKIGMTRRLEPKDRVHELGDASVPFEFDVHAMIYTEDAPGLEAALHRAFHHRRVNRINERKEFFRASLAEIAVAVRERHGAIEFTLAAEAREYRLSLAIVQGPAAGATAGAQAS